MSVIYKRIGIIGLGLIGGALAGRIRQCFPTIQIEALDTDQKSLDWAKVNGLIHQGFRSYEAWETPPDIVVIATPLSEEIMVFHELKRVWGNQPLVITDVWSIKQIIETQYQKSPDTWTCFGGHPMTGSEKSGVQYWKTVPIENAVYFLVPPTTPTPAYDQWKAFVTALGFRVAETTAQAHDTNVGLTSHMPYFLAIALVNTLKEACKTDPNLSLFFGPGFKDMTRLAAGSVDWGTMVSFHNKDAIKKALNTLQNELETLKTQLINGAVPHTILPLLQDSQTTRKKWFPNP